MSGSFIVYLGVGKLLTYIVKKFISDNTKIDWLNRWASCELCSGVWIYTALAYFLKITILSDLLPYVPFVSEAITGCACSMIMHLLTIGWHEKFDVVVI